MLFIGSLFLGKSSYLPATRLSEKFLHNVVCFILFCRITYDPFCSVEINTATFHKLGFTFV